MKYATLITNHKSHGRHNCDTYTIGRASKTLLNAAIYMARKELRQDGITVTSVKYLSKREADEL